MRRIQIPARVTALLQTIGQLADQQGLPAYAVGGCVRDWLSGIPTLTDLDVTVEGSGIDAARATATTLGGTVTVHQQFGTATVILTDSSRRRIDFASCRREVYAKPGAYPRVCAGTLDDDLCRRDFTVNAMAVAIAPGRFGILVDPFQGERDLREQVLRVLHARSFLDDPSRILRGVRFAARFGFRWEPQTQRAARQAIAAGALGWLNPGRLRRELERIQEEPDPVACLYELEKVLSASVQG